MCYALRASIDAPFQRLDVHLGKFPVLKALAVVDGSPMSKAARPAAADHLVRHVLR